MNDSYKVLGVGEAFSIKCFRKYAEVADGNIEVVTSEAQCVSEAIKLIESGGVQGVFMTNLALKDYGLRRYDAEVSGFNDKENPANDVYSGGLAVVRRALDKGIATFVAGRTDDEEALRRAESMGARIDMTPLDGFKNAHALFLEMSRK